MASDAPTDAPAAPQEEQNGEENEQFDEERAKAKITKANSEAANLRKRLKELEAKASKLDELENASKTEVERATSRAAELERRVEEAEFRALRLEVASAKGLTPGQAKRLVGATQEELESDADALLAEIGEQGKPRAPAPTSTQGKPTQGTPSPGEEFAAFLHNKL